jgi:hypothetical protein
MHWQMYLSIIMVQDAHCRISHLKLWLDNAITSAKKCILSHGEKVSTIQVDSHRINCQ